MEELFGKPAESTSKPVDALPEAFKDLRSPYVSTLTKLLEKGGNPFNLLNSIQNGTFNSDSLAIPETANEQELRGLLMDDARGNVRGQHLNDVISGKYLPGQEGANPFLDAAIRSAQRPTLEGLTETLDRTLPGRFTQAGQFVQPQGSSAFDRAAAIATRGATNAMADIATNISYAGYDAERGRQDAAVPLSQQEVETTVTNLQAQALPRMIQQYGVEAGTKMFNEKMTAILGVLQLAGQSSAPQIAQEQKATGASPGIFGALFPQGVGSGSLPIPGV